MAGYNGKRFRPKSALQAVSKKYEGNTIKETWKLIGGSERAPISRHGVQGANSTERKKLVPYCIRGTRNGADSNTAPASYESHATQLVATLSSYWSEFQFHHILSLSATFLLLRSPS